MTPVTRKTAKSESCKVAASAGGHDMEHFDILVNSFSSSTTTHAENTMDSQASVGESCVETSPVHFPMWTESQSVSNQRHQSYPSTSETNIGGSHQYCGNTGDGHHCVPAIKLEDLLSDGSSNESITEGPTLIEYSAPFSHSWDYSKGDLIFKANRFHCHLLMKHGMMMFIHNVLQQRRLKALADGYVRLRMLKRSLFKWTQCYSNKKTTASKLLQNSLKRKLLHRWNDFVQFKKHLRMLASVCKHHQQAGVVKQCFVAWNTNFKLRVKLKLVDKLHAFKQQRKVFQAWQVSIYQYNLKKLSNFFIEQNQKALLQACFNRWVLQTAVLVGEDILSSKLHRLWQHTVCHKAFEWWLKVTRLNKTCKSLLLRKAKRIFSKWRDVSHQRKKEGVANRYHSSRCLKQALLLWNAEYKRLTILKMYETSRARSTLQSCVAQWHTVAMKSISLVKVVMVLECTLDILRLAAVFQTWRRQVQCLSILRHHRVKCQFKIMQCYFSSWRAHTLATYDEVARLFVSKLCLALDADPLSDAALVQSTIYTVSHNLGIKKLNTLRSLTQLKLSGPFLSTQHAHIDIVELQSLSNDIKQSLLHSEDTHTAYFSASINLPFPREEAEDKKLQQSGLSLDEDHCHACHNGPLSQTQTQFCSCLDPQFAHEIQRVQQKLSAVSSATNTPNHKCVASTLGRIEDDSPCHENDPILSPPPGFSSEPHLEDDTHSYSFNAAHDSVVRPSSQSQILPEIIHTAIRCVKNMQLYPCNRSFYSWYTYTKKKSSLRERLSYAIHVQQMTQTRHSFKFWRAFTLELGTLYLLEEENISQTRMKTLECYFKQWKRRQTVFATRQEAEHSAVMFDKVNTLRNAFDTWKQKYTTVVVKNEYLQECRRVVILSSVIRCWSEQATKRRLLKRVSQQWRHKTKVNRQQRQAQVLLRHWCLSKVWMKWRKAYICGRASSLAAQVHRYDFLKQVLTAWQVSVSSSN